MKRLFVVAIAGLLLSLGLMPTRISAGYFSSVAAIATFAEPDDLPIDPDMPIPTPTPDPLPTPSPVPTPDPTPMPNPTPEPVPTPDPTPMPNPTPEPVPTPDPTPMPNPTPPPGPGGDTPPPGPGGDTPPPGPGGDTPPPGPGGDMPPPGPGGDMPPGPGGDMPPGPGTSPDLSANTLAVVKVGPATFLKGTVKNLGSADYTAGRTYKLERSNGSGWTVLKSDAVPALKVNQVKLVETALFSAVLPGSKFRLSLSAGDAVPANDVKLFTAAAAAATDLAVINLNVAKIGPSYQLRGTIKNLGPAPYAAGRSYKLERWNGAGWTTLKSGLIPPLALNALVPEAVVLGPVPPPAGAKFRMILTGTDAVPANNGKLFTVPAGAPGSADLAAFTLGLQKTGPVWRVRGSIRNFGPAGYLGGRTYRLERLQGGSWVTIKSGLVNALPPGGSMFVDQVVGPAKPRVNTWFRLTVTGVDAVPGNNVKVFKVW